MLVRLLYFGTGFAALICEVCWIRLASLTLGSSIAALAIVLATFFGGLALGSFVFGRYSTRCAEPLRQYAWLELGVGCWALASPWLFQAIDGVYGLIYESALTTPWLLALVRLLLICLILMPATTLMGGSLPLLCQMVMRRTSSRVTSQIGQLYAINTLGAAGGAALTGCLLIPTIGLTLALALAAALNILVSLIAFRLALKQPEAQLEASSIISDSSNKMQSTNKPANQALQNAEGHPVARQLSSRQRMTLSIIFFGIGLVAVGSEVLWTRYLSLWMPNTVYTYTLTLTVVLLGIVVGSALAACIPERFHRRAILLGIAQIITALSIMLAMQWRAEWWGGWLNAIEIEHQLAVVAMVMSLPAILSGASFPLAIGMMIQDLRLAGFETGRMSALNLVGGIVGSLWMGFIALPMFGLAATVWLVTGLSLVLGLAAWWMLESHWHIAGRFGWSALAVLALVSIPLYCRTELPRDFLALDGQLVDYREGVNANVSVIKNGSLLQLEINRMWQGQNSKNHQVFAAHIPALLHPEPREVLVVGLGTGQTASSFLDHPIKRLDCVEIEDGLVQLVREHFNGQWLDDARVQLVVEDGRNFVTHTRRQYDIISIEVGQIYRPRIASFYTVDFYRQLKPRLHEQGLICQFMPIDFFGPDEFATLLATFRQVFPASILWYNTSELLLIGTVDDQFQVNAERIIRRLRDDAQLRRVMEYAYWGGPAYNLSQPESFLAGFLCGPAQLERLSTGGRIYRDDHPYLEYLPVKTQSEATTIVAQIQRQLTPISLLVGPGNNELLTRAQQIRQDNLLEIVAKSLWAQGRAAESAQDLSGALAAYQQALRLLPNYPPANFAVGELLAAQGELAQASEYIRRALASKPQELRYQLRSAELELSAGHFDVAEQLLRQAIIDHPRATEAHTQLGWLLGQIGKHQAALQAFETALELNERSPRALLGVANVLQTVGQTADARQVYRDVLQIEPELIEARIGLALSWQRERAYTEALAEYQAILKQNPEHELSLSAAAWLLATHPQDDLRDSQLATELAERALARTQGQSLTASDALAAAYANQGKFNEAIQILDAAIAAASQQQLSEFVKELETRRELYGRSEFFRLP